MYTIHRHLDLGLPDHLMFWAACCLAYFGFLRASEFTVDSLNSFSSQRHVQPQDITLDSMSAPKYIRVNIKASKTDPFRKGTFIYIGKARPPLCAVEAILAYLHLRGSTPGPLFLLHSGQPLSRPILTSWLRQIMRAAGFASDYSSHSFRIGAATVAARNGLSDHLIQSLVRWSSDAYKGYIRTPVEALAAASAEQIPPVHSVVGAWFCWGQKVPW
ncbi:uncharacterized protein LOC125557556 [Nematostella vectensis]|uniref:uncharacterized protein LOC125557556 n=1 Tax=Nematostella vectensis TaxID=45351 RepID=UPI0020772425|nr:uncharacterized protein LOC125557556 [Nematostella vectensis]